MLIYILEDDDDIREIETYALKNSGFDVKDFNSASNLYEANVKTLPDLYILDIMLPDEDGLSVLKKLRSKTRSADIPVILVTAKTTEIDRVKGLDFGADDYICKPFGVMELVSRVKARLRRKSTSIKQTYSFENITLSEESRVMTVDGVPCELTFKEFELMKILISHPGKAFSRDYLMDSVWGEYDGISRTLDMHVKTLRHKLGNSANLIKTVRNVGYKLDN